MIGKIKKGSGFKGCVNYVLGKEQAKYYLYISCNSHTVFLLLLNYIRKRKFDYFIIVA